MKKYFELEKCLETSKYSIKRVDTNESFQGGYNKLILEDYLEEMNTPSLVENYNRANFTEKAPGIYSVCFNDHSKNEPCGEDKILDLRDRGWRVRDYLNTLLDYYSEERFKSFFENIELANSPEDFREVVERTEGGGGGFTMMGGTYTLEVKVNDPKLALALRDLMFLNNEGEIVGLFGTTIKLLGNPHHKQQDFIDKFTRLSRLIETKQIDLSKL